MPDHDMIVLRNLRKEYPGLDVPAVGDLSFSVPEGEIAVLVGPSECGKTTTMRMINRIIEPTSGRIILDGEDVTRQDPDQLRRRMGYVIQQVGLFPHMTISDNVATVPRMLSWSRDRIRARVDEMLHLVGLDPSAYRNRYPKELSGGQQQRVGVARALCADPPVMLMDEPFGAIDPVTRERLQDEFLRLQSELRKTIVFVTHDVDEAIKMGDRIAILRQGGHLAQYDTPDALLAAPADDFVREFIGGRATLRRLGRAPLTQDDVAAWPVLRPGATPGQARGYLATSGAPAAVVVDEDDRPLRLVTADDLDNRAGRDPLEGSAVFSLPMATPLADVLDELLRTGAPGVAVVDGDGRHAGVVDVSAVVRATERLRTSAAPDPVDVASTATRVPGERGQAT